MAAYESDIPGMREMLQQFPAAVVVAGAPGGEILFANRRAEEMVEHALGGEVEDLLADVELFASAGRPLTYAEWPLVRCIASGEQILDEEVVLVAAGVRRVISCSCAPVLGDEGELVAGVLVVHDVTERTAVEERLAYHASLLDNLDDAVVGTDPEFRLTVWNRGAERLYGFAAAEVLGRDAREVASYAGDQSRLALERELQEADRARAELTAYRKDGSAVEVELIAVAVRDGGGAISGYLGIHRDVTERKHADGALRDAERRMREILESLTDAFIAFDHGWGYTYLNERALADVNRALGAQFTREDLIGRKVWDLFPDFPSTSLYADLEQARSDGRAVHVEAYSELDRRWVEVHAYPSSEGLATYTRDVTARRRAGEELGQRAAQQAGVAALGLRALAGQDLQRLMDDAAHIVASTLNVELVKVSELLPGGSELLIRAGVGWRAGVVGSETEPADSDSAAGYSLSSADAVVSDDLAGDRRFNIPGLVHEHGARSAAAVVIGRRGAPFGVLGALSRSPRRFSDDDVNFLQAVAHVLATTVERSQTERRLRDAREAERRRIARDLHDEALRDLSLALTEAQRVQPEGQLVPALKRVGHRLRGAIYDLRLTAEQQRPLSELLEELVQLHRALAEGAVVVELDVRDGVPGGSFGHRGTELLRIVGEGLTNARRHSGARSIRVGAWASDRTLCVEVADDGGGFDPDSAATAAGTGLRGMRERAAGLGSELTVRSAPGEGTSVRVGMPLVRAGRTEPVRVLLVDDHAAVREAIALAFRQEPDFEVAGQAGSLAEARQMLQEVDIAVIDLGLPDGDGGDLIRDLREVNPRAQAIVLSASIDRSEIARAVDRGAAGVLEKTAGLDEVVHAVRRLHAGETLLPLTEVVELLRVAAGDREREREDRDAIARLTPREREVLQLLGEGLDSQGIADRLHITIRTERNHIANILAKLGVHSQLQALVFALRHGLTKIR